MNEKPFGVDTAFPPPPPAFPPPPHPGYPPQLPGPSARARRRWPVLVASGIAGAIVASAVSTIVTVQARDGASSQPRVSSPTTVTVAAPTPPAQVPLPTAEANRQTCRQGWIAAGNHIKSAQAAVSGLPPEIKVGDPAVASNPQWAAAVQQAADFYRQAGDALAPNIAPGTTPVLAEAARTSVKALRLLADAIRTSDPITGNAVAIANETTQQTGDLCVRLVPS